MMRVLANLGMAVSLVVIGLLVWVGQQRTPDRYLEDIQRRGVLRVGLDPTYPPFESIQAGKLQGYDIDLANAIAADLGVQVSFSTIALDGLYDALQAGKVDMLISALPFIYERQSEVRYSKPYYQAGQVLLVRSGETRIASPADLSGKRVGVELGSAADTEARRLKRTTIPGMELVSSYKSPEEAMSALLSGQVDAAIADGVSAQAFQRSHESQLSIVPPPLTDEPYVIAMRVQATGLSARVDAVIERLRTSGQLAAMMGAMGR